MSTIVIVGAGQAGGWVAKGLRDKSFDGTIVLLGEESHPPHERPPLSKAVLLGEADAASCQLFPADFAASDRIDFRPGVRVTAIDRAAKRVRCADATEIAYDKLVIATGGRVRTLDLPGAERALYLRTIEDSAAIGARLAAAKHAVVIGGGWIGLEVAAAARKRGVAVSVIEPLERVCARGLPPEASEMLAALHREHGVDLRLGRGVRAIEADRVMLDDGTSVPADVVVAGVGLIPNVELARAAGLEVANGVVVDEHGRTNDPDIYAAGDVTFHPNRLLGRSLRLESWANAQNQGVAIAAALTGATEGYAEQPWFWSDQYDVNLQILGAPAQWSAPIVRGDAAARRCSLFYLRDEKLDAVIAVNSPRDVTVARRLMQRAIKLSAAELADPNIKLDALLKRN